ncbi:MAG: ATP-binding protein [Candidatus Krumholzibacteriia bacterium]
MIGPRARDKALRFIMRVDHAVPRMLRGDPVRIRQVLVNLVNNAVKFTESGDVFVRVAADRELGDHGVRLEVEDTGVGIPADRVDSLWDSFSQVDTSTTRKYGGTGLGLTICKQLVELMGGEIGVRSELGRGSCFWVRIPFTAADDQGDAPEPLRGKVLLALACPELNDATAETLRFLGLEPVVCAPGPDLALQATLAMAEHPDCQAVITGPTVQNPTSRGVARKLQAVLGSGAPPCAVVVGAGEVVEGEILRRDGYAAWLSSPLRTHKLREVVANLLAPAAARPRPATAATAAPAAHSVAPAPVAERDELPLLLAEDNPVNQKVASILLRKLGYAVEVVDNGAAALAALARRRYRLVLMDVQMPVMDGYEAVRRIRLGEDQVLDRHVPIIALTAHAMKGDRQRCLDAGMDDYLAKPIDASALADLLDQFLGGRQTTPA